MVTLTNRMRKEDIALYAGAIDLMEEVEVVCLAAVRAIEEYQLGMEVVLLQVERTAWAALVVLVEALKSVAQQEIEHAPNANRSVSGSCFHRVWKSILISRSQNADR